MDSINGYESKTSSMTPKVQSGQDIMDKYTKTNAERSGIVKRKVPARVQIKRSPIFFVNLNQNSHEERERFFT
ncbi:MAG: hypothetical protein FIB07_09210 [Candidatus Methanoperedens sp.]|nr:hypothetical protein [Candidatus Methanoperedens sp.]